MERTSEHRFSAELITPEIAEAYLKRNVKNRPMKPHSIEAMVRDIKNGKWCYNGETIVFNKREELSDGQNRLEAIKESGIPCMVDVVRNVDCDDMVYDIGVNRNIRDIAILNDLGVLFRTPVVLSLTNAYVKHQTNRSIVKLSPAEVFETITRHMDAMTSIYNIFTNKTYHSKRTVSVTVGITLPMFYALENGYSESVIGDFLRVYSTGMYENPSQIPAIILRNDVLSHRVDIGSRWSARTISQVERAIYDFANGIQRKKTYSTVSEPTFSHKDKTVEDEKGTSNDA